MAVGAKWMYRMVTVNTWKPIQNRAASSSARPRSQSTTTEVSSATKANHCMTWSRPGYGIRNWPSPFGRRMIAQSRIELSGQLVRLQPPLRILVSAGQEVGEDHRDLDALERPAGLRRHLSAAPATGDRTDGGQHPERDDQGHVVVVDLAVAHPDRGPPGEGGGHDEAGQPRQPVGRGHDAADQQNDVEGDGERHTRRRQVQHPGQQQRRVELRMPAQRDRVADEGVDVEQHERVEHGPQDGHPRLRQHGGEPAHDRVLISDTVQ